MSRVLVAYGSKHGATGEIAERIGRSLRDAGHEPEVRMAGDVRDVEGYDAVVLGSAVYGGRWRRDARRLLRRLRRTLDERPLWLFSSGPVGESEPDLADKWQHPRWVREVGEHLEARDQMVFRGRIPSDPSNMMERAVSRQTPEEDRDGIEPAAIDAWAERIAQALRGEDEAPG